MRFHRDGCLSIPGYRAARRSARGRHSGFGFLTESNKRGYHEIPDAETALYARDRRVVVIGGAAIRPWIGVRTAIRQGAASVTCLYRRDRETCPLSAGSAECGGGGCHVLLAHHAGRICRCTADEAIKVQAMRLGSIGTTGRRDVEPVPGDVRQIQADLVVLALGFEPEDLRADWRVPELGVHIGARCRPALGNMRRILKAYLLAGCCARRFPCRLGHT